MLLVLHGAKRNVGDFLIRQRALALIDKFCGDESVEVRPRWEPIPRATLEQARAVVIAGGPGLSPHFYPGVFPLVADLSQLRVPVLPVALGWVGRPKGHPEQMAFDPSSLDALRHIHRGIGWSSVRDVLSLQVLERADVGTTRMTGCVVWYDLDRLFGPIDAPSEIGDVVVTTPASLRLVPQCARLLAALAKRFPSARRRCVFHRGIGHGPHSKRASAIGNHVLARAATRSGWEVVDAAGNLDAIAFYAHADLHVGYRVHAHLAFLSARRPSILIEEDGRGAGQAMTLHPEVRLSTDTVTIAEIVRTVDNELANDFPMLRSAVATIDRTFPEMQATLEQLVPQ
jgi:hypothetical protein